MKASPVRIPFVPVHSSRRSLRALRPLAAALLGAVLIEGGTWVEGQTPAPESPAPAAAASAGTTSSGSKNLVELATAAGNFKTLLAAAKAAGLADTLQKEGPWTVFAPTDEAFAKLPAGRLESLLRPENKAELAELLKYHLASGKIRAADLAKRDGLETLEGDELDVQADADGKTIQVDDAKILTPDLEATNGIIHVIDRVLIP